MHKLALITYLPTLLLKKHSIKKWSKIRSVYFLPSFNIFKLNLVALSNIWATGKLSEGFSNIAWKIMRGKCEGKKSTKSKKSLIKFSKKMF